VCIAKWKEENKSPSILRNATAVGPVNWPVHFIATRPLTLQIQASGFTEMTEKEILNFPSFPHVMAVPMRRCPYAVGSAVRVALVMWESWLI